MIIGYNRSTRFISLSHTQNLTIPQDGTATTPERAHVCVKEVLRSCSTNVDLAISFSLSRLNKVDYVFSETAMSVTASLCWQKGEETDEKTSDVGDDDATAQKCLHVIRPICKYL